MIVGQPGSYQQVVTASELRVGDRIALAGAEAEVRGVCLRSVGEVTVVEACKTRDCQGSHCVASECVEPWMIVP
ncbi:unnamed protein product [Symbiodinium necroappetens]|uniref:Uncharacterized protein n=1 Tax=Symbiodinium necroappetens TaxID=1628268 RepID=A0A813CKG5_9DINO|nr:unnamed protein product [Symbiodinium necroappetens]